MFRVKNISLVAANVVLFHFPFVSSFLYEECNVGDGCENGSIIRSRSMARLSDRFTHFNIEIEPISSSFASTFNHSAPQLAGGGGISCNFSDRNVIINIRRLAPVRLLLWQSRREWDRLASRGYSRCVWHRHGEAYIYCEPNDIITLSMAPKLRKSHPMCGWLPWMMQHRLCHRLTFCKQKHTGGPLNGVNGRTI